jgi:hypothetical protein
MAGHHQMGHSGLPVFAGAWYSQTGMSFDAVDTEHKDCRRRTFLYAGDKVSMLVPPSFAVIQVHGVAFACP